MTSPHDAWFRFYVGDAPPDGVDARLVAGLITDLSDAVLVAARQRLGAQPRRAGPISAPERALAAIRLVSVIPGSVELRFAEPPTIEDLQPGFFALVGPAPTPDLVALDIIEEIRHVHDTNISASSSDALRASVERLLKQAARIGDYAEVSHRSWSGEMASVSLRLSEERPSTSPAESTRQLTLFGHSYMIDVEAGRQRLRIKLANERDLTMDLDPELREDALRAMDQPVEVLISEIVQGGRVARRVIESIRILDLRERGPERPAKSVRELAAEQGVLFRPAADYVALASAVWPSTADVDEAIRLLQAAR